jgi:hypothetical protein
VRSTALREIPRAIPVRREGQRKHRAAALSFAKFNRPYPRGFATCGSRAMENLDTVEGVAEGTIVEPPRGTGGFGYDPVFQPAGLAETFGEIVPEKKNRISHRANAIRLLRAALGE